MTGCRHGEACTDLLTLITTAVGKGWRGAEAEKFCEQVLPALVGPLKRAFPVMVSDEVSSVVFIVVNSPKLVRARCARGWIRSMARRELINFKGQQEPELRLRERLVIVDRDLLRAAGADAFVDHDPGRPVGHIWGDLGELLPKLRFPKDVAGAAVAALQELVELSTGKVRIDAAAVELGKAGVQERLRRPLARFVFDEDGYVQARVKGYSAHRALRLATVQAKLKKIMWNPAADTRQLQQPGVRSGRAA